MTPDSKSRTVEEQPPQPEWTPNGVPNCSEECRHHDGKRCGLMGLRAPAICEPTVEGMAAERITLRSEAQRMREALTAIIARGCCCDYTPCGCGNQMVTEAEDALRDCAALQPQPEEK